MPEHDIATIEALFQKVFEQFRNETRPLEAKINAMMVDIGEIKGDQKGRLKSVEQRILTLEEWRKGQSENVMKVVVGVLVSIIALVGGMMITRTLISPYPMPQQQTEVKK